MIVDMNFSKQVHNFLDTFKKENISTERKEKLYKMVTSLEDRTESQKRRFLLYYGLIPKNNYKQFNFTEIGKIENCSFNAIRYSVARVESTLATLQDERKSLLLDIIKEV